jgi:hypothetical protein
VGGRGLVLGFGMRLTAHPETVAQRSAGSTEMAVASAIATFTR